nr:MAG TPA: hypothetical protein [Caudoviricetes sp.]DAK72528.1 MAG TPA: hypothetical protein [Caudoviricetes sp.]
MEKIYCIPVHNGAGGSYKNLIRPACKRIVVSFSVSLLAIY